jgi:endonuclease/exonuclease/phosphatase family metal-dependent hydrolase
MRKPYAPKGASFSIATYNVNYGGYRTDLGLKAIQDANADIVCLQETNDLWEKVLTPALGKTYPHILYRHHGSGAGGMSIFSKYPIKDVEYMLPDNTWFPAWIVEVESPLGKVQLLMVHLHPSLSDKGGFRISSYFSTKDTRLREIKRYHGRLQKEVPAIVLGDFNEKENVKAMTWLRKQGFTNALSEFDSQSHTWRWRGKHISLTRRFDHIMYSKELRACSAKVIPEGASDHLPVVAVMESAPAATPASDKIRTHK